VIALQHCIEIFSLCLSASNWRYQHYMCRKFILSHFPTKQNINDNIQLTLKDHATESAPGRAYTDMGLVHSGIVPECVEMREELPQ
jgi:hypothetical protein